LHDFHLLVLQQSIEGIKLKHLQETKEFDLTEKYVIPATAARDKKHESPPSMKSSRKSGHNDANSNSKRITSPIYY